MDQVELKSKITGPFGSPVHGSTADRGPIDTNENHSSSRAHVPSWNQRQSLPSFVGCIGDMQGPEDPPSARSFRVMFLEGYRVPWSGAAWSS